MSAQGDMTITGFANEETGLFNSDEQGGDPVPGTAQWDQGFESYANDTALTTFDSLSDTSGTVSTTQAATGTKSAKHTMTSGSDCALEFGFAKPLTTELVEGDEIWIQGKFFYPTGWDFGNDGNAGLGGAATRTKFFRVQTYDSEDASLGYIDIYLWMEDVNTTKWQMIYEGIQSWAFDGLDGFAPGRPPAPETNIVRNDWITIELYIKLHHTANQSIVRLWEDNVLNFEITDLATMVNASDYANLFRFCTYVNGGAPATQDMFTDDWKIYTSASPPTNTDADDNVYIG